MTRPNFLIVQADQLSAMVLGVSGNAVADTPHLDSLMQSSMTFRNAYCNFPLCAPSRVAMLTGRLSSRSAVYDNACALNSEIPTYAHYLQAAGYHTCLSGKMHFVGADQLHGFEGRLTTDIYPSDFYWTENKQSRDPKHKSDDRGVTLSGICDQSVQLEYDDLVMQCAVDKLTQLGSNSTAQPWLLHVSLTHPHDPYYCREEHWNRYTENDVSLPRVGRIPIDELDALSLFINDRAGLNREFSEADILRARRGYLGSVSYFDDQLGKLIQTLEQIGQRDNTVIIVTSDHGEMLGERGMWYKRHHFEWSAKIPLVISAYGDLNSGVWDAPVSHVDLLPTLLQLADVDTLVDSLDGQSLLQPTDENVVLGESMSDGIDMPVFMVRQHQYKLICSEMQPDMLYDLSVDADECNNVAQQYPDVVARLKTHVADNWQSQSLQKEIDQSIARRLLIRQSHLKGKPPEWDYMPDHPDNHKWCRSGSDYTAWSTSVLNPR
ncbi:MAG: choline-sulfatase [Acidiferrobacterales bacterium]|nr:choline-sulfatase [Acidiferrobacterales bacterium]